jgi:hypothetical protein
MIAALAGILALAAAAPPPELKSHTPAAAAKPPMLEPVTKVDGRSVQVASGARAVFHLNGDGSPALDRAEKGGLAAARPPAGARETFAAPEAGQVAVALDGSTEAGRSYLKIWNRLDYPLAFRASVLRLHGGVLRTEPVKACAAPAGRATLQTWPGPVAAVTLGDFKRATEAQTCR